MDAPGQHPRSKGTEAPGLFSAGAKRTLFVLLAALFVALSGFTLRAYLAEASFYAQLLDRATGVNTCPENLLMFEVAIAPFRSLATVRTAALFLSFVLVLVGALFVLIGIEAAYRINLDVGDKKAALETASPGLVLVTAGSLLIGASLYRSGSPEFHPIPGCAGKATPAVRDALSALNPKPEAP